MASQADIAQGGPRYRTRTEQERDRAFRSASRHSRLVRVLRRMLPVVAVLVLAAYFVTARLSVNVGDFTASIDGLQIADGNLRMMNPTLKGADKKSGDYVVRAEYADQDIENPNIIKLHAINANIDDPSGGWSKMQADRGVFDTKAERLVMKDRISIATDSGLIGRLSYATLDMATNTMRSHNPVYFEFTNGTVHANAMTLRSKDEIVVFRGNVRVHLEDTAAGSATEQQPQPKVSPSEPVAPPVVEAQ